jgi:Cytochrome c3
MLWVLWLSLTVPAGLYVLAVIVYAGDRSFLLIGRTTSGHHQIELACDACHARVFGDADVLQDACVRCHGAELKAANDSHPKSKFTDPRNADRTAVLDAAYCVTCHQEHRSGITHAMGVTLPKDYCFLCHYDIADDRPSHKGLAFTTCASAGCHRFHDNRALYQDFLIKHAGEPSQFEAQRVALIEWLKEKEGAITVARPLLAGDADAPAGHRAGAKIASDWAGDRHAQAGVNCSGCHTTQEEAGRWIDAPNRAQCKSCHASQATTFTEGKHGMRLREGLFVSRDGPFGLFKQASLPPMTPAQARLPMKADAHGKLLGCNTCHSAHKYDRAAAAVEACIGCHDDAHTKAYFVSPHYDLFKKEKTGQLPPGSGVSCATCHMPATMTRDDDGSKAIFITHNQNDNLRPNEKMVRSVCGQCHGLQFTLDALADPALVTSNFKGLPTVHVESIEWAQRRAKERGGAKK